MKIIRQLFIATAFCVSVAVAEQSSPMLRGQDKDRQLLFWGVKKCLLFFWWGGCQSYAPAPQPAPKPVPAPTFPGVVLYEDFNYQGRSLKFDKPGKYDIDVFQANHFNDVASSLTAAPGWAVKLCYGAGFLHCKHEFDTGSHPQLGDSNDKVSSVIVTGPAPKTFAPTPAPTPAPKPSIVDIATGDGNFSILVSSVVATGLLPALQGDGPLTVFAPTNKAFSNVPVKFVNDKNYLPHLKTILLYHLLGAEVFSNQLSLGLEADTLSGESIRVTNLHPLTINQSKVIKADVDASNGVVHVIDSVLLPTAATRSIVDLASTTASLSTLVSAVVAAELAATLSDATGSFTVFAPTNDAFAKLGSETLEALLLPANKDLLVELLLFHVVVGDVITAEEIGHGPIGPQNLAVTNKHPLTIEQSVVVTADILANNGVVHLIDAVLIPDGFKVPTAHAPTPICEIHAIGGCGSCVCPPKTHVGDHVQCLDALEDCFCNDTNDNADRNPECWM